MCRPSRCRLHHISPVVAQLTLVEHRVASLLLVPVFDISFPLFFLSSLFLAESPSQMAAPTRYFTAAEVAAHNSEEDVWISFLGRVHNLSPLVAANNGSPLIKPLVAHAGKDVSHWFNQTTGDVRHE